MVLAISQSTAIGSGSAVNSERSAVPPTVSVAPNPQAMAVDAHTGRVFVTSLVHSQAG
jgi:hypothetical protein